MSSENEKLTSPPQPQTNKQTNKHTHTFFTRQMKQYADTVSI